MSVQQNIKDKEYVAQKGSEIYNQSVLPTLDIEQMKGKIIAIDVDTGEYTRADTTMNASLKLRQKQPQRRIWLVRVGYPYVRRLLGVDRDKLV